MNLRARLVLPWLLAPLTVLAGGHGDKAVIKYTPPAGDDDERPIASSVTVTPQGTDFALRIEYTRPPWGEACKSRCANTTIFLDTDDSTSTGLKLGKDVPESGADLAVMIQGVRNYKESSAEVLLRVKVKRLSEGAMSAEDGDELVELDNRHDPDRLQSEGNTVFVTVDGTDVGIPSAKMIRVIYHPPADKALVARTRGMAGALERVEVIRKGKSNKKPKKKGEGE